MPLTCCHIETHYNSQFNGTELTWHEKRYNMFQYGVTLLTTFNGWGRALSDCPRQALFLVATILKHTTSPQDSNLFL